jgi:hypothetical protein
VNEQDRLTFGVPGVDDVEPASSTTRDEVMLHLILFGLARYPLEIWLCVIRGSESKGVAAGGDGGNTA